METKLVNPVLCPVFRFLFDSDGDGPDLFSDVDAKKIKLL